MNCVRWSFRFARPFVVSSSHPPSPAHVVSRVTTPHFLKSSLMLLLLHRIPMVRKWQHNRLSASLFICSCFRGSAFPPCGVGGAVGKSTTLRWARLFNAIFNLVQFSAHLPEIQPFNSRSKSGTPLFRKELENNRTFEAALGCETKLCAKSVILLAALIKIFPSLQGWAPSFWDVVGVFARRTPSWIVMVTVR